MIAEASIPSHGVGDEIGAALGYKKPVLGISQEGGKISSMISGNPDPLLKGASHTSLEEVLLQFQQFYV